MKKEFRDRTYQVLGVILLFTFTITAVSDFLFTGVIRTALGAVILGYVSGVRFKKPELNAEYHLAYLQYFWVTATVFCLWSLLAAMEVPGEKPKSRNRFASATALSASPSASPFL